MTPDTSHVVWETDARGGFATLLAIENVEDDYRLKRGVALADGWPSDALFRMNPAYPRDVKLADAVHSRGGAGVPVVSPRLRAAMEALAPPDTEYLPVTILDHKGRVASDEYAIVNPFRVVDVIDQEATLITWNPIDKELIADTVGLVLDPARLDPDASIFRPRYMPTRVLLRADLAAAIGGGDFTGLRLLALAELGL